MNGNVCQECDPNCQNCSNTNNNCTSCTGITYLNPILAICILDCTATATTKLTDQINNRCLSNCDRNLILNGQYCVLCSPGSYKSA
jgi:hypothetical protein